MPIRNLRISRQLAIMLTFGGLLVAIVAVVGVLTTVEVNTATADLIKALMIAMIGTALPTVIGALKSTEAADTAAKAKNTTEVLASDQAALRMEVREHMAGVCPSDDCPLRVEISQ